VLGYLFAIPPGGTRFCLAQMAMAKSHFDSHKTSQNPVVRDGWS